MIAARHGYRDAAPKIDGGELRLPWTIPHRASGEGPGGENGSASSSGGMSEGGGEQSLRILIIEDNRDYADGLQLYFQLVGHEAAVAYNGIEGVEAALRHELEVQLK